MAPPDAVQGGPEAGFPAHMSKRSLLLVFGLALAARLLCLLELADDELFGVLLGDAARFDSWAREIAAGNWRGGEVFYQAPLYPYFMALVYRLADADTMAIRLTQAVLGAAGCALIGAATGRLFGGRVGAWAGGLAAVYAPAIWLDGLIQKTSVSLFLTALLVYALARHVTGRRLAWAALIGFVLGLLVLVRENAAVLLLPLGAWFLRGKPTGQLDPPRGRALALFATAFCVVLLPVGIRNASLGGVFLPTASNAGVNFYIGNSAASDGLYTPLVRGQGHPDHERTDARAGARRETGQDLSPAEVSAFWFRRGVADVRADPVRWLGLLARKSGLVLNRVEVMDSEALEAYRDASWLLRVTGRVTTFGLLLPLAVVGFLLSWRDRKRLWPFYLCALFLAFSIVLFFVAARFRIGLAPFLIPFAGLGLVELVDRLRAPQRLKEIRPVLLAGLVAAVSAHLPARLPGNPRATTASNLASAYLRRGEFALAFARADDAVRFDPSNPEAFFNRGLAGKQLERFDLAEEDFRTAMELEPTYAADGAAELGALRAMQNDIDGALAFCRSAIAADPRHGLAHYYLGLILRNLDRLDEAAAAYEAAILHRPDLVDAHHNLGKLRELQGRNQEAVRHYRDALEIDPTFERSREALHRVRAEHPQVDSP
jgi:tetratricopeptide (TPR) repeat protein